MSENLVINGPYCPFFGWFLKWDGEYVIINIISNISNRNITFSDLAGSNLINGKKEVKIKAIDLLDFLIEKWNIISKNYKKIKSAPMEAIVDFSSFSKDFDFQLVFTNNTVQVVSKKLGKGKVIASEELMLVESISSLGDNLYTGLHEQNLYSNKIKIWKSVRNDDFLPPVVSDDIFYNELKEKKEFVYDSLKFYKDIFLPDIVFSEFKKIMAISFIYHYANILFSDRKEVLNKIGIPENTDVDFLGFDIFQKNKIPNDKQFEKLCHLVFKESLNVGLVEENETFENWMDDNLYSSCMSLRSHIYYSKWPSRNLSIPKS